MIAGFVGRKATKGKAKTKAVRYLVIDGSGSLEGLMPKAIISLRNGFKVWSQLNMVARSKLQVEWQTLVQELPEDLK